jgi:hypothetical protein
LIITALKYFSIVFGAGFILGTFRVMILEPSLGLRLAELLEAPVMALVILLAARWITKRCCQGCSARERLRVGMVAAALVLLADLIVGLGLRGISVAEVFFERDPVSGPVYYGLVAWMAIAPLLLRPSAR